MAINKNINTRGSIVTNSIKTLNGPHPKNNLKIQEHLPPELENLVSRETPKRHLSQGQLLLFLTAHGANGRGPSDITILGRGGELWGGGGQNSVRIIHKGSENTSTPRNSSAVLLKPQPAGSLHTLTRASPGLMCSVGPAEASGLMELP